METRSQNHNTQFRYSYAQLTVHSSIYKLHVTCSNMLTLSRLVSR